MYLFDIFCIHVLKLSKTNKFIIKVIYDVKLLQIIKVQYKNKIVRWICQIIMKKNYIFTNFKFKGKVLSLQGLGGFIPRIFM